MKLFLSLIFLLCIVFQPPALAGDGWGDYFSNAGQTFSKGVQNALTFYLEIPMTIQEYHEKDEGRAGIRHMAGLSDGIMRAFHRGMSVPWDLAWAFIPDHQEGSSIQPETLF